MAHVRTALVRGAMPSAPMRLAARHVTESVDDDGVAMAIEAIVAEALAAR